jgi:hypothetical protein
MNLGRPSGFLDPLRQDVQQRDGLKRVLGRVVGETVGTRTHMRRSVSHFKFVLTV